ncbi:sulfurtransferase [Clostridium ihumii]|uniref:sulfurtransferase n=1 Tax=Clostridium ihumii TaxID=1470356 RepID=UPI000590F146|nr:sulfurtransferase [Clostridium ihumii]
MLRRNTKIISLICATILSVSLLAGCSSSNEKSENTSSNAKVEEKVDDSKEKKDTNEKYVNEEYIVSIDWLKENLNSDKVIIVDTRDNKDYKKGHIKNAINVTWQDLSNMEGKGGDEKWATLLEKDALSAKLSELGLSKDKTIVLYTSKNGWGEDGRVEWSLKSAGYNDVKMLNGGIDLWESEKLETSKDDVPFKKAEVKVDKIDESLNITTDELKGKVDKIKVIDTREKDEYEGATKYGEARGGHIPGAINITFNTLYNEDGTLKSQSEIEKIMTDNGIKKDDEIVTYCTSGIRSGHMAMVLKLAGYENVKNYDQSYIRWAAINDLKVEK